MLGDSIKRSLKPVEGTIKGRLNVHIHPQNFTVVLYMDGKAIMQLYPKDAMNLAGAIWSAAVAATGMRRESVARNN